MAGVRIEGVTKRFGQVRAVDSVDLAIEDGELFFLLGPSGCGKTTLLRMVAGFYDIEEGRILFDDTVINDIPAHKRETGMVFQSYALWPHMSVERNVSYGLKTRGLDKAEIARRTKEALASVKMSQYIDRMPNQLSGGQQQRVALARALVLSPKVVLLDEPLSNLDAKLRLEMRSEIRRIHRETGVTIIYVTHDQKEALSMADRLAVINMGRIEQVGTPQEVYNRPANPFVAGFIGETNFLDGEVAGSAGGLVSVRTAVGDLKSSTAPEGLAKGDRVVCSIRPESLHLVYGNSGYPTEGKNIIEMVVKDRMYLGEMDQYQLDAKGVHFAAIELNKRGKGVAEGESAKVAISPKDVLVFTT